MATRSAASPTPLHRHPFVARMVGQADFTPGELARLEAVIEWTHFKPKQGVFLRGDEWYVFSPRGLIREIRAYYSCPPAPGTPRTHEIGDFDYRGRGYPMTPPAVRRAGS